MFFCCVSGKMILLGSIQRRELEKMIDHQLNLDPLTVLYKPPVSDSTTLSAVPARLRTISEASGSGQKSPVMARREVIVLCLP